MKNNCYGKDITNTVIIYVHGVPQSPEFQETISRSVSPTNSEISASSDKSETQSKRQRWSKKLDGSVIQFMERKLQVNRECKQPTCLG